MIPAPRGRVSVTCSTGSSRDAATASRRPQRCARPRPQRSWRRAAASANSRSGLAEKDRAIASIDARTRRPSRIRWPWRGPTATAGANGPQMPPGNAISCGGRPTCKADSSSDCASPIAGASSSVIDDLVRAAADLARRCAWGRRTHGMAAAGDVARRHRRICLFFDSDPSRAGATLAGRTILPAREIPAIAAQRDCAVVTRVSRRNGQFSRSAARLGHAHCSLLSVTRVRR